MIDKILLAMVATFFIGSFTGYKYRSNIAESEKAKAISIAYEEGKRQAKETVKIETVYLDSEEKINTVYKYITKEVIKNVPVIQTIDSECNLSTGTIGLLKTAVDKGLPSPTDSVGATNTKTSLH